MTTAPAALSASPARVMICDDSAVIRSAIARILDADPDITVVARAANGRDGVDTLRRVPADVIVLDIEMPVLDGIGALPQLLAVDPRVRIVMASTLTTRGADIALRALRLGAADYIPKPSAVTGLNDLGFRAELLAKVKGLARLRRGPLARSPAAAPRAGAPPHAATRPAPAYPPRRLARGRSTGGPPALRRWLAARGAGLAGAVVITQHMPPAFTTMLAAHITALGGLPCAEAKDREALLPGRAYLAPGDRHLLIEPAGVGLVARLSDAPAVNYCRPAVDPMLLSAAAAADGRVLVAMLTGMGHDGLEGTRAVIAAGGAALAQDEATSVGWGMPGAIAQAGLCHAVLPLAELAPRLRVLLRSARP